MRFQINPYTTECNMSVFANFDCRYDDYDLLSPSVKEEFNRLCAFPKCEDIKNSLLLGMGASYCVLCDNVGIGYFTLTAGAISRDGYMLKNPELRKLWPDATVYPAIRIMNLAMDRNYHGKHLIDEDEDFGKYSDIIMEAIINISKSLSKTLGVAFIMVDALAHPKTLSFYSNPKHPFQPRATEIEKFRIMMLGMNKGINSMFPQPEDYISMYLDLSKIADVDDL